MHAKNIIYQRSEHLNLENVLATGFVARSAATINTLNQVRSLANSDASVLINGESGTGKEVIARYCHRVREHEDAPFVAVNCAALPHGLFESELFGHKKGSFTGATHETIGLIRKANGGTLFLDEIGDMPIDIQAKLLRVVQERKVRPVGGNIEVPVDFRIICATHTNLLRACDEGKFRKDLYFRLSVVPIFIPSLKQRTEDIIPLARHHMNKVCAANKKPTKGISNVAQMKLLEYPWPGNVRELNNVIERAMIYSQTPIIEASDIVFDSQFSENYRHSNKSKIPCLNLKKLEKIAIENALAATQGNRSAAARELGIDRKTLRRKENEYNIIPFRKMGTVQAMQI